jgi:hypothetical protein
MKYFNIQNVLLIISIILSITIWKIKPLSGTDFAQPLLNLTGTVFLAMSLSTANDYSGIGDTLKEKL